MFEVCSLVSSSTSMHILSGVTKPSKFKIKWEKNPQTYVTFCYVNTAEILLLLLLLIIIITK